MEIQKIFSNVEDPEENLYSVLMSEEELSLFSEIQKEFNSKVQKKILDKFYLKTAGKLSGQESMMYGKRMGENIGLLKGKGLTKKAKDLENSFNNGGTYDKVTSRMKLKPNNDLLKHRENIKKSNWIPEEEKSRWIKMTLKKK